MYLGHDEDKIRQRRRNANAKLYRTLGLALLLFWLSLALAAVNSARGEHLGTEVEEGDTMAVLALCNDLQAAATGWREILRGAEEPTPEAAKLIEKHCVFLGPQNAVALTVAEILGVGKLDGDDAYLVRYEPIRGLVTWGVTFNDFIMEKGKGNGRRSRTY